MRYPKFLENGGTIGFTAPSFGCTTEPYKSCFEEALKRFEELGYKTEVTPDCYMSDGVGISTDPKECAKELEYIYSGSESDVIISVGGGELMCDTIAEVDFESLKKCEPKWYMGYSDNTNFTFLLNTLLDTASIYAPCAPSFGMKPWDKALQQDMDILTGKTSSVKGFDKWEKESLKSDENPYAPYNLTEEKRLYIYKGNTHIVEAPTVEMIDMAAESGQPLPAIKSVDTPVKFKGRIIGGCLDTLITLCGTRFDKVKEFTEKYKEDGIIWFIESCDLSMLQIRRALFQFKNAGWFNHASGFIFGRPCHFNETEIGVSAYNAVTSVLGDFDKYIVMDADIGHLPPTIPIVSGAIADVTVDDNISIQYIYE